MRYPSIDILRTIAIFVMVLVHFSENLSGFTPPVQGFGAPLFAFLSGVSYRLWSKGLESRGVDDGEITKISVRRGLFVFGLGFMFNILVWLPEDTFNWDVLTFIGAALLFLTLARKLPMEVSMLTAALLVLASPVLRALVDYPAYWTDAYFDPDLTLSDVTIGFLVTGYFPLFPWLAFSLAGFVAGSTLFEASDGQVAPRSLHRRIMMAGGLLVVLGLLADAPRLFFPTTLAARLLGGWQMFPATVAYVLIAIGLALLLTGLMHRFVDGNPRAMRHRAVLDVAKTFSRYSLTMYVLHHIVHLWPLWIYGVATGNEPTHFWMKAMPVSTSLALATLFLVISYLIRWLCDEPRYRIG
jgi:uncharacterized membrane protein